MDTIFALASGAGKAGVAVIRVSGPRAHEVSAKLAGRDLPGRGMIVIDLRDARGDMLDQAIVLSFAGPASFTGEDVVELHLHGSIAVVRAVLGELGTHPGLRLAEPGEFTRRALENGKLDLVQVEGLADLIDAETEAQRRQAQASLAGRLGELAAGWRSKLIRAAALLEATIDFADEEVPTDVTPEAMALISDVEAELLRQVSGAPMAERVRLGFEVAIIGPPNAGKSTLLNALAGRDAAITSEHAGTTRDIIEVRMDIEGLPVTLLDTAGLRASADEVEGIGIDRARKRAEDADLRVFLTEEIHGLGVGRQPDDIHVFPKADLGIHAGESVSGKTGEGVDALMHRIASVLSARSASAGLASHERQRVELSSALAYLKAGSRALQFGPDRYELVAEELRSAVRVLESLVGHVGVEDLLDEIFASFCLGK